MPTERIIIEISERGARKTSGSIDRVGASAQKTTSSVDLLKRAFQALVAGVIVRGLLRLGDTMISIGNKVGVVTEGMEEATFATSRLFDIARETRAPIAQVAQTFQRMALAADALGVSQGRVLTLTENLTKAVQILGASGHESTGAMIQLAQGLGAGELRGQELNSVLEQAPVIAKAIAEQLGVSTGELKKLGAQGKISSQQIFFALEGAADSIAEQFGRTTSTVSQGLDVIKNAVIESLGTALLPVVQKLADTMLFIADNVVPKVAAAFTALLHVVEPLAIALAGLALAMAGNFLATGGGALAILISGFGKAVVAVEGFGLALATALGPIGLVIAAGSLMAAAWASVAPPTRLTSQEFKILADRGATLSDALQANLRGVVKNTPEWVEYNETLRRIRITMGQIARGEFAQLVIAAAQAARAIEDLKLKFKNTTKEMTGPFLDSLRKVAGAFGGLVDAERIEEGRRKAKQAAQAYKQLVDAVRELEDAFDPVTAAVRNFIEAQDILNRGIKAGIIERERALDVLDHHREKLLEVIAPFDTIIKQLMQEQNLLKLSNDEREIQTSLLEIQERAIGDLNEAQLQQIETLLRQNQALRDHKEVTQEIWAGTGTLLGRINPELDTYNQGLQRYIENLNRLAEQRTVLEGVGQALVREFKTFDEVLQDSVIKTLDQFSRTVATVVSDAVDGTFNIREAFHNLAKSIARDITQILIKQALIRALVGTGGFDPKTGLANGGIIGALTGLQHGGEFRVGGSGGPDSQLVAFRASPNETVSVKTPGQQTPGGALGIAIPQSRPTELRVINAFTPAAVAELMRSPEGAEAFLNVVREHASEFRDLIEYG